jgi:hypothetical protein
MGDHRSAWWAPASRLSAVLSLSGLLIGLIGLVVLMPSLGGGFEFIAMGPARCFGSDLGCATDLVGSAWFVAGALLALLSALLGMLVLLLRWAQRWPRGSRRAWSGWRAVSAAVGAGIAGWATVRSPGLVREAPGRGVTLTGACAVAMLLGGVPAWWVGTRNIRRAPGPGAGITPAEPAPHRPGW